MQDNAEPNQPVEENSKHSAYTSITQEPRLATVLTNIKTRAMRSANNSNSVGLGSLDIDTERFLKVLQPDNSFIYTFAIKDSNQNNNFRNLILKEVNGGFIAAVLEYEPVQELQVSSKFIGTIRRYNLEGKLLRVVTVIENQSTPPVISANGVNGNSTITESTCIAYVSDGWECIPNGLPTENPGPGECLGGGTWTYVIEFMQVPCNENPDDGTYLPGGSGGSDPYNGSGGNDPYYGSGGSTGNGPDPINGGSPAPDDEFIGVVDPGVIKLPTPLPYITAGEGAEASDYDDAYWSNPSLVFPAQDLPNYQNFNNVYPRGMSGLAVFKMIGGEPLDIAMKQGKFNACAARVSYALNYSGITIPHISDQTFKGVDGKYYFIGARNMEEWMTKTFGASTITVNANQAGLTGDGFIKLADGRKGIYFMRPEYPAIFTASGHADIFNGFTFDKDGYFGSGFYSGKLWILQ